MQTFMPHKSFADSAAALDDKRLRNQRNECKAIMRTIHDLDDPGWKHHPACWMWWLHPAALATYALAIVHECDERGFDRAMFYLDDAYEMFADTGHADESLWDVPDRRPGSGAGARALGIEDFDYFTAMLPEIVSGIAYPPWIGWEEFHLSHRSNLIRKRPSRYGRLWPEDPDDLPYVWPVRRTKVDGGGYRYTDIREVPFRPR